MATKRGTTTTFFSPLFLDPGSGMDKNHDPGSGINTNSGIILLLLQCNETDCHMIKGVNARSEGDGRWQLHSRVQRIWLFFRKWRIQTLRWVQNWNLRHIYKIGFLIFCAVFCAFGFKVCKKSRFWVHFFKTFSTDSKSAWNSAFFDTHIEFFNKNFFLAFISTFCTLWLQMRRKRLKKTENLLWMYPRILLGNHQRVCITKFLKSLYPSAQGLCQTLSHPPSGQTGE